MKELIKNKIIGTQFEWQSHIDNVFQLANCELIHFRPKNLLDVGCGCGDRTLLIANHFRIHPKDIYGIDIDTKLISSCNKKFNAKRIDLEIENLPFDDGQFDLVICNQVLEHLKNDQGALRNIVKVTKRNGYILIGVPNLAHLINRLFLLVGMQPLCCRLCSSHVRSYTHSAFVRMLQSFQDIKLIASAGAIMYPLPYFLAKLLSTYFKGCTGYVCYLLQKL